MKPCPSPPSLLEGPVARRLWVFFWGQKVLQPVCFGSAALVFPKVEISLFCVVCYYLSISFPRPNVYSEFSSTLTSFWILSLWVNALIFHVVILVRFGEAVERNGEDCAVSSLCSTISPGCECLCVCVYHRIRVEKHGLSEDYNYCLGEFHASKISAISFKLKKKSHLLVKLNWEGLDKS